MMKTGTRNEQMAHLSRRRFVALAAASTVPALQAQSVFPDKPIKIITPFAPGSSDVIARRLGEHAARTLGQPVVVETRPGAQGTVATRAIAKAKNDGYTLLLGTNSTHSAAPYLFKDLGYDPLRDYTPIIRFTVNPLMLVVHAQASVRTLPEFLRWARERSGQLNYGVGNTGSQVAAQMLKAQGGFEAEPVNYPGNAQAVTDFVAGRLDFMVTDPMIVKPFLPSGKLRIIGLSSRQSLASFADVGPLASMGLPNYDYASWIGLFGPAGLAPDVLRKLHDAFAKALAEADSIRFLADIGMIAAPLSSEEFAVFVQEQTRLWARLTKDSGLTPQ